MLWLWAESAYGGAAKRSPRRAVPDWFLAGPGVTGSLDVSRTAETRSGHAQYSYRLTLDAETEHALIERYAAAARAPAGQERGQITVLVSHRFSTVRMADLIVVIDGSRVVEQGDHDALMAHNGTYAELYGIQEAAYR